MHSPVLRLKLRVFAIQNLMTIVSALTRPTTVQIKKSFLLSHIIRTWDPIPHWGKFCLSDPRVYWSKETRKVTRPPRPLLMSTRSVESAQLAKWKLREKRKGSMKNTKRKRKRTPFTQKKGPVGIRKRGSANRPISAGSTAYRKVIKGGNKREMRNRQA